MATRHRYVVTLAAALALLGVLISAGGRPAEAAFPGLNGRISYMSGEDIWTTNSNGSDPRDLMPGPNEDDSNDSAWSPDGTKIAFSRYQEGVGFEIFTMNADGTGLRRLTFNFTSDRFPAWSPDGSRIVFSRLRTGATLEDAHWDIWVRNSGNPDRSSEQRLTSTTDRDILPAWSPDGRKIAFARNGVLWVMNSNGTGQRRLSKTGGIGSSPDWSPDGTEIVYAHLVDYAGIALIGADGTGDTPLTTGETAFDHAPAFSPDGRHIVYTSCPRDETPGEPSTCSLRRMRLDDLRQTDLTVPREGEYHLFPDWQPLPAFHLDDSVNPIRFGEFVRLSGELVRDRWPVISSRRLILWEQPANSSEEFTRVPGAETTTGKDGSFAFEKVQPKANTNYQIRFAGDKEAGLALGMSPIEPVDVRTLVSLDLSTDKLTLGKSIVVSGEVQPRHRGEVLLTIKRDGERIAQKHASLDEDSRYSFSYEPPQAGLYSMVARYPTDGDHAVGQSQKGIFEVFR